MFNFLLTGSVVITEKYYTGVLTVLTELCGFSPYIKDPCVIYSGNDLTNEVEKRFIICFVFFSTCKIY